MSKFKVGDRVIVDGTLNAREFNKAIGTIVVIKNYMLGVNFDNDIGGHALSGYCKLGHGWWIAPSSNCIRRYNDRIIIYRDGDKVVAKDYLTNEIGVSRCHPDDEFDFKVGAKIAFDRLIGVEDIGCENKPNYYNGKVVCVNNNDDHCIPIGQILNLVDGNCEYGGIKLVRKPVCSIDELNSKFGKTTFIEVVE